MISAGFERWEFRVGGVEIGKDDAKWKGSTFLFIKDSAEKCIAIEERRIFYVQIAD